MIGQDRGSHDLTSLTEAFVDLRWIDLTAIQLATGGLFTLVWLKLRKHNTLHSVKVNQKAIILTASFGNMVGNLATNAAYASISSSMTQMIKACEPVFTFVFLIILRYKKYDNLNCSVLFSLLFMSAGTCLFVIWDSSFNVWGITAAVISNIA
jgi:drug/metabolite transporter (DMT)-like permease